MGARVPVHVAFFLGWVAVIAGLLFAIVHAMFLRYFAKPRHFVEEVTAASLAEVPAQVPRHSLAAACSTGSWR